MPEPITTTKPAKPRKPKADADSDRPGLFARLRAFVARGNEDSERLGVDGLLAASSRIVTGAVVVVLLGSWALGRGPLERHVASLSRTTPAVVIEWPTVPSTDGGAPVTWVPKSVQADLARTVDAHLTPSPFDQAALIKAATDLTATGWFTKLGAVQREAGGTVRVTGEWRVPAAVVRKDGRSHLVAMDGAILKLPENTEPPERLSFISNPASPAPRDDFGTTAYGVAWLGNDVQSAISLLRLLHGRPEIARQISGIDLSEFTRSTKLVLVTDRGHRIVWGSPVGDLMPGEVRPERKIARLAQNLKDFGRIDADQPRVEIYTPVVLVDKTAGLDATP